MLWVISLGLSQLVISVTPDKLFNFVIRLKFQLLKTSNILCTLYTHMHTHMRAHSLSTNTHRNDLFLIAIEAIVIKMFVLGLEESLQERRHGCDSQRQDLVTY